ncbi:MAG: heat-inducible transcription repressor HrcA [Oscillospiraceae bacterium]|nr:heat-inducible transcription repressor HrcA [Oscillospiraceae bacterium]
MELDSRKQKILKAIIEEYTATGEPVGSKRITSLLDITVSPATVRNDMAQLFDMGMLEQPHTSAGRVPSHLGYRYYLDHILEPPELTPMEQARIQAMFNVANPDPDRLLEDAAQALANFTRCAALFSTSTPQTVRVSKIELIPANERTVIIMVIASNGVIKNKVCRMPFEVNAAMCQFFTNFANERLARRSLNDIASHFASSVSFGGEDYAAAFNSLLSAIYELCREINDGQFYSKGHTNLLYYEELKDAAGDLLLFLDKEQELRNLISEQGGDVQVIVGKENSRMELSESSVVITRYRIGRERCGTIGVIGPVRMDYARLIPRMQCFANLLSELLSESMSNQL